MLFSRIDFDFEPRPIFASLRTENSRYSESRSFASEYSKRFLAQRLLEQTDSKPSRSDHHEAGESLPVRLRQEIRNYQNQCQDHHGEKGKQVQRHLKAAQRYLDSDEFGACDFELCAIERILSR